ncbi:lysine-specific demethylase 8 isoform X1 [Diabrotica undecimpunctata]|uniref:lysine-specific demethylase 8 isoform X1 n=1 Tax=Diabrotica undecimpunctata TaxID=50387 RepID=UPI003B6405EA
MDMKHPLNLQRELKKFIYSDLELHRIPLGYFNRDIRSVLTQCLKDSLNLKVSSEKRLLEINVIIDYLNDELNLGHWCKVPIKVRHCFTICSYVKCLILLNSGRNSRPNLLKECLNSLDMGLLLGAPLEENPDLLTGSAEYLRKELQIYNVAENKTDIRENLSKRKIDEPNDFMNLKGRLVESVECPSLQEFIEQYFFAQVPVKIKGCLNHWPASKKWTDLNYLLEIAGDRTVPIEVGSQYTHENWSQKLMTLKDFVTKHYLSEDGNIGYLAQHNLFEQIPKLKDDICIPEYCGMSVNDADPDINAWFGPKGTVSPLHTDPSNNLLAQVYGTKQVILFAPSDTQYLYPHEEKLLNNTAQVNPVQPDLEEHPQFTKATMFKCLLEPGEMLFIPEKWWHHVTALDKSFSVSFWWK